MSRYFRYLKDFEKAVGGMTAAMDGMHQEHQMLKKQFRTYLADHEKFASNVRRYLDELEIDDGADSNPASTPVSNGQNDNERHGQNGTKAGGNNTTVR